MINSNPRSSYIKRLTGKAAICVKDKRQGRKNLVTHGLKDSDKVLY
ncbi:MAG: hypothetical protein ACTHKJ_08345 [Candidatus Nitrosocosmicus sp.]